MPPKDLYEKEREGGRKKAIERVARYVSLIPFVEDTALFKDMPNLCCTS